MLKIEHTEVVGWEHAIRGMRNPLNSWEKSDSLFLEPFSGECCNIMGDSSPTNINDDDPEFVIGSNDYNLMQRLRNAGTDHRKYLRMITVYADVTAPLYYWKEMDTYKVGTVANSCSTMHKIHAKEFTLDDFSHEHLYSIEDDAPSPTINGIKTASVGILEHVITALNYYREYYLSIVGQDAPDTAAKAKEIWWQMIELLPSSYNQKRTLMLNYEVLTNIYKSRRNHKLDEWHVFCDWIEGLPYSELITGKPKSEGEKADA